MNRHDNATATAVKPEPPEAFLTQVAFGALMSQALYIAAKLGIADLLKDKPQPVSALAAATATHEMSLYRVLRSLAGIGVFQEVEPEVFALTPHAEPLRSDAPGSMRNGVIFMGEEWHWRVWGNMLHSVRTGKPAWGHVHGAEVFDYFTMNPEQAEIFNRAMTDMSVSTAPAVVEAYNFNGIGTLCDIAGGHGYLLAQVLKANPDVKGILFDMPQVIAGANAVLDGQGVTERIEKVAGDFFESVPSADAYMMKHIIHDWDDERAIVILQSIHAAMNREGKVLIIETVVPEDNEPHYSKLLDLEMLTSPGGVERTAGQYRELLAHAGFKLTSIIPTKSPFSIVEAVKN
ncbi:MAG: acetylserotonin O-methyltransferase [Pyrinomonadaceae bacterium MAG19_C2-C3]|nr:acetylserotonin O-methyltransferase [Pyrinomonadaceae bacterium MAG19_C2-C3]